MAILFGPLHSDDARGKLASALVFMGWKGIKTVRAYVTPANPQTPDQGDIRTVIGGTGRAAAAVKVTSSFEEMLETLELIPDQQSKQSWIVQQIKNAYFGGKTSVMTAAFKTQLKEFTGVTAFSAWQALADELAIGDFKAPNASIATYDKGLGLYLIAKLAIAKNFTVAPYDTTLTTWTAPEVALFSADLKKA